MSTYYNLIHIQNLKFGKSAKLLLALYYLKYNTVTCYVIFLYADFAKAFDSVNHAAFVLEALSFGYPLLDWLHSYLLKRSKWVKLSYSVISLIFLQLHLDPTRMLFALFINSESSCTECFYVLLILSFFSKLMPRMISYIYRKVLRQIC